MAAKQRKGHVQPDRTKTYCIVEIPSTGKHAGKVTKIFEIDLTYDDAKRVQQEIAAGVAGRTKSKFAYVKLEEELRDIAKGDLDKLTEAYFEAHLTPAPAPEPEPEPEPATSGELEIVPPDEIEQLVAAAEAEEAAVAAATEPTDQELAAEIEEKALGDTHQRAWPPVADVVPTTRGIASGTLPPPNRIVPPSSDWRSQSGERKKGELDLAQRGVGDPGRKDLSVKDAGDELDPPTVKLPPGPFKPDPDPTK